ncbi:MAG TPA: SCO family protein [Solirubrobacterales bacterium]
MLVVLAGAAVGVLLGLGVHRLVQGGGSGAAAARRLDGAAVWPAGMRRAPEISLPDSAGKRFTLASARGRPVILTFMDSRCHQECPLEGRALAAGLRRVPAGERPLIVVVSIDPWEDTPASARRAIRRFGLAGFEWRWLLGSRARLAPVWKRYRIFVRRAAGDVEHTAALYLIDGQGYERAGMVYPFLPTWVSGDLGQLAAES